MHIRSGLLLAIVVGTGFGPAAVAQEPAPKKELTARELFYTAAEKPAAPSKVVERPPQRAAVKPPAKTATQAAVPRKPPSAPAQAPQAVPAPVRSGAPGSSPDGTPVIAAAARRTAPAPANGQPLGLKFSITKLVDGRMVEVSPDSPFRAGDRIRINVMPNSPGFLYIISQGSSGTWKPMFPSPEVEDGNNRVDALREYAMPPGSRIVFDSQPGTERLFIVLSREPENDLEQMIYSLQAPAGAQPAATEPAAPRKEPARVMVAANISNDMVGRMRNVYARDLVIEKVDDDAPSAANDRKEKAVYVVNPSGSSDSRVVADLNLVHQ
jgi:hypothetical protein